MWWTPPVRAISIVSSVLPSSITIHSTRSNPGTVRGRAASVIPRVPASLKQGIWITSILPGDIAVGPRSQSGVGRASGPWATSGGSTTSNRRTASANSAGSGSGRSHAGGRPSTKRR